MTVVLGDTTFKVPVPVVTENGNPIPFTTEITGAAYIDSAHSTPADVNFTHAFDINTPGLYVYTYSAINSDGFAGSSQRFVFVFDKAPDPSVDLSGDYTSGSSPAAKITKIADGVWYSTNIWGGGSTVKIGAYLMSTDGINIQVPLQESSDNIYGYGTRNQTNGTLNMIMSRPLFATPLFNVPKNWIKK